MKRALLLGLLLLGSVQAAGIKVRPQGTLVQVVQAALAQLSTKDVPMTLDATSGPTITLGGVGISDAPFNPDEISRVVLVGSERRIEINPQGPVPLAEAVKQTLMAELKLKEWTPAAAQQRFGGADLNGDGVIDLADLAILMANFGTNTGAAGDLNQDRKVDDADVRLFSAQYSRALAEPAPLPTPAPSPATTTPGTPGSPASSPTAPGTGAAGTGTPATPGTPPAATPPATSPPAGSPTAPETPPASGTPTPAPPAPSSPPTAPSSP